MQCCRALWLCLDHSSLAELLPEQLTRLPGSELLLSLNVRKPELMPDLSLIPCELWSPVQLSLAEQAPVCCGLLCCERLSAS